MRNYPVFLNIQNKKTVVFGAGSVACRKIKDLLQAGASVQVRSLDFSPEILKLASRNTRLKLLKKGPISSLIRGSVLVFAATSDAVFNRKVANACRVRKVPVNVADQPEAGDFLVPSSFVKGRLQVAISTGGASPLLARKLREELESKIRPEALKVLDQLSRVREKTKKRLPSQIQRKLYFEKQISSKFRFLK